MTPERLEELRQRSRSYLPTLQLGLMYKDDVRDLVAEVKRLQSEARQVTVGSSSDFVLDPERNEV